MSRYEIVATCGGWGVRIAGERRMLVHVGEINHGDDSERRTSEGARQEAVAIVRALELQDDLPDLIAHLSGCGRRDLHREWLERLTQEVAS